MSKKEKVIIAFLVIVPLLILGVIVWHNAGKSRNNICTPMSESYKKDCLEWAGDNETRQVLCNGEYACKEDMYQELATGFMSGTLYHFLLSALISAELVLGFSLIEERSERKHKKKMDRIKKVAIYVLLSVVIFILIFSALFAVVL